LPAKATAEQHCWTKTVLFFNKGAVIWQCCSGLAVANTFN
jgi:hypothetical protein